MGAAMANDSTLAFAVFLLALLVLMLPAVFLAPSGDSRPAQDAAPVPSSGAAPAPVPPPAAFLHHRPAHPQTGGESVFGRPAAPEPDDPGYRGGRHARDPQTQDTVSRAPTSGGPPWDPAPGPPR